MPSIAKWMAFYNWVNYGESVKETASELKDMHKKYWSSSMGNDGIRAFTVIQLFPIYDFSDYDDMSSVRLAITY